MRWREDYSHPIGPVREQAQCRSRVVAQRPEKVDEPLPVAVDLFSPILLLLRRQSAPPLRGGSFLRRRRRRRRRPGQDLLDEGSEHGRVEPEWTRFRFEEQHARFLKRFAQCAQLQSLQFWRRQPRRQVGALLDVVVRRFGKETGPSRRVDVDRVNVPACVSARPHFRQRTSL